MSPGASRHLNHGKGRSIRCGGWLLVAFVALASLLSCQKQDSDLPKLGSVAPFEFQDQAGQGFSSSKLRGKAWVGAFFFTRCPTVCPKITARMLALQKFGQTRQLDFHLVSFTIDPDFDTSPVLQAYAQKHGVDGSRWTLLTGDAGRVKALSEGTFRLAMSGRPDPNADHLGMIHSGHLVLVDREGLLRGQYRSSDEDEMRRLERDLTKVTAP